MAFKKSLLVLWIGVLFCVCGAAWGVTTPIKGNNSALTTDPVVTQKQLDRSAAQLADITKAIEEAMLPDSTLQLMQQQIESVMERTTQLQHEVEKKADDISSLLDTLGPAPKANESLEDPVTAEKRQQLVSALALYNGQSKQARALMSQSISLSNTLAQRRLQNKAKGLLQRSLPLYDLAIWQKGFRDSDNALLKVWNNTLSMFKQSIVVLQVKATAILFTATSFLIIFLGSLLGWLISRHFGQRFIVASPNLVRKIITTIADIIAMGILPLAMGLLIVLYAKKYLIIYEAQWYILSCFVLMLGGIWIGYLLIKNILSPDLLNWRILKIKDTSAKPLAKQLMIFFILAILNWFITIISEGIPFDFLILCEFLLRTAACISGLILLKKRYWTSELIAKIEQDKPKTTRNAQLIFINYLRITAITIFISNPIFMLLGYIHLANFLFISFIQTVAIVAILLGLHITFYQILGKFTGVGAENVFGKTFNLGERSREILHYWLIVIIDIVFFIIGLCLILIGWGLDSRDLWRFIKPIFVGFNIGHYQFSLITVFVSIAALITFFVITRVLQHFLNKRVFPYTNLDYGVQNALHQGVGYVGITVGILVSIGMIGINLTNLALIAGALSVGIGFGLQNIVSNFIAGIIVLVERPIKIGDRIIVGQDEGTVRRISVRATEIEAGDGSSILVPNSELIAGRVRNWTFRNPLTKLEIIVGVAYGSDTRLVEKLLLQVAMENTDVTSDPPPKVSFTNFGPSSLEFRLGVCIYDINKRSIAGSELRYAIEKIFRESNIEMPFPQCNVHIVPKNM